MKNQLSSEFRFVLEIVFPKFLSRFSLKKKKSEESAGGKSLLSPTTILNHF